MGGEHRAFIEGRSTSIKAHPSSPPTLAFLASLRAKRFGFFSVSLCLCGQNGLGMADIRNP